MYNQWPDEEMTHLVVRNTAPLLAAIGTALNIIWRRQVLRIIALLAGYLALWIRYGLSRVHPIFQALKVFVLIRLPSSCLPSNSSLENSGVSEKCISNAGHTEESVDCQVLHDPGEEHRTADVIFIHGLHGSLTNTWRQGDWGSREWSPDREVLRSSSKDEDFYTSGDNEVHEGDLSKCWPQEWLPQDIPGARVIALNYTTDPHLWRPVWITKRNRSCMVQRSREMMQHLQSLGVGDRPIVWVGHSKGGIFVKQMLVDAWEKADITRQEDSPPLCRNTKGILFYSVPHRGSALALINVPLFQRSIELIEVKKDCPKILDLHDRFLRLCEMEKLSFEMVSFYETRLTKMSVVYLQIVAPDSADPEIGDLCGVSLDHRQICKPRSRNCFLYKSLTRLIERVV